MFTTPVSSRLGDRSRRAVAAVAALMMVVPMAACVSGRGPAPAPDADVMAEARALANVLDAAHALVLGWQAAEAGTVMAYEGPTRAAIATALAAPVERCGETYRALPLSGAEPGGPGAGRIAVYLVPVADDVHSLTIGGFYRLVVDAATGAVVEQTPLGAGCHTLTRSTTAGASTVKPTFLVHHTLTDHPLENHVLVSAVYGVDLIVATASTTWRVSDGNVRALR